MKNTQTLFLTYCTFIACLLSGCTTSPKNPKRDLSAYPIQTLNGKKVRLVPAADYLLWKEITPPPAPSPKKVSIAISLSDQRAWLFKNGEHSLTAPISSGGPNKKTPTGVFHVINKHEDWTSTTYHTPMPYFLRLNADEGRIGLHQGKITAEPSSHGCVRLPEESAKAFFAATPPGSTVAIFP